MKRIDKIFYICLLELNFLMLCAFMYAENFDILEIFCFGSMIQGFIILGYTALKNYRGLIGGKLNVHN